MSDLYFIHLISILVEFCVMALGVLIATKRKKIYGWLIALTFGIYVVYDLIRYLNTLSIGNFAVSDDLMYVIFFIASVSALIAVWLIYKKK